MIAMALMCDPELIIADEPTTALDVTIQAQILHLLRDLQREFRMAMILITHDLGIIARVTDRVAVMYAGQVVETGTVKDVFTSRCIPTPMVFSTVFHTRKTQRESSWGPSPAWSRRLWERWWAAPFATAVPSLSRIAPGGAARR